MIKIEIQICDDKVFDSFNHKNSILSENGIAIRRLEEIKKKLLNVDYDVNLEIEEESP